MASRPWRLKRDPNAPKVAPTSQLELMKRRALYAMYVAQEIVDGQPKQSSEVNSSSSDVGCTSGSSGKGSDGHGSRSSCCFSEAQATVSNLRQLATNSDLDLDEASLADAMKAVTAALTDAGLGDVYAAKLKREVLFEPLAIKCTACFFMHQAK